MGLVHAHAADFVAMAVNHRDVIWRLEQLHQEIPKNIWHAAGPTLVAWRLIADARYRKVAVLFHDLRGLGLQNGIGVVTDQLLEVSHAVGAARLVLHWAGPRFRRLEAGQVGVGPDA